MATGKFEIIEAGVGIVEEGELWAIVGSRSSGCQFN
jgi:hypothetical protein